MGLLRPLQGHQPESRNFLGTASCRASPWTFPTVEEATRGTCGILLPVRTKPWEHLGISPALKRALLCLQNFHRWTWLSNRR